MRINESLGPAKCGHKALVLTPWKSWFAGRNVPTSPNLIQVGVIGRDRRAHRQSYVTATTSEGKMKSILLVAACLMLPSMAVSAVELNGTAEVIDGDTLK